MVRRSCPTPSPVRRPRERSRRPEPYPVEVCCQATRTKGERPVKRLLVGLLVAGGLLAVGLQPALASPAVHIEQDVTGAVFTCTDATYTIVSGSIRLVLHEDVTASGNMNVTGTLTPEHVVAQDEAGNLFDIVGASWFGGSFNASTGGTAFTDTEKFQIVGQGGGTVGSVNLTTHISPNGDFKSFDFGSCMPPPED